MRKGGVKICRNPFSGNIWKNEETMQQQSLTSMSIHFFVSNGKLERSMTNDWWKRHRVRRHGGESLKVCTATTLSSSDWHGKSRPACQQQALHSKTLYYTAWDLDAGQTGQSYFDCGGCVTLFVLYVLWASCEVQAFCTRPGLAGSPPMTFSCSRKSCAANMSASHIFSSIKRAQRV